MEKTGKLKKPFNPVKCETERFRLAKLRWKEDQQSFNKFDATAVVSFNTP